MVSRAAMLVLATAALAAGAAAAEAPAAGSPSAAAAPTVQAPAVAKEKQAACESYVAVLSGRKQDAEILKRPELDAIASSDLVMCGAVRSDSDALCTRLTHGPVMACRQMRSVFHELRAYPNGRSFMFNDIEWEECRKGPPKNPELADPAACDALRDALRSADEKKCAQTRQYESFCRAFIKLDPSLCTLSAEAKRLAEKAADGKEENPEGPEKVCQSMIESRKFLGQGLKSLAASGPSRERELAKAALGDADACSTYEKAAMEICTRGLAAAASTPAPATGQGTPASSGTAPN